MWKNAGYLALLLLLACPGSGGGSNGGDPGNGGPGTGGPDGSQNNVGAFSVALASQVTVLTKTIVASAAEKTSSAETVGLALGVKRAEEAKPADDTQKALTGLEVWFTDPAYVESDGYPVEPEPGKPYVVVWDVYDPAASSTVSVKSASPTVFAADKVTFDISDTNRPARRRVQVGGALLDKSGGVVLSLGVYRSGSDPAAAKLSDGDAQGLVSRQLLTILRAADPDLSGAKVSANGVAGDSAPSKAEIDAGPIAPVTVSVTSGGAAAIPGKAWVTLTAATPATATGKHVAFNNFAISGGTNVPGVSWTLRGSSSAAKTFVGSGGSDGNTAATATNSVGLAAKTRADFVVVSSENGQVSFDGVDKYGRGLLLVVTLDDGLA